MQLETLKGVLIICSLIATIVAGAVARPSFESLAKPSWQPRDSAFAIWGLIYTSIALGGAVQLLPSIATETSLPSAILLSVSLLCSAAWIFTVERFVATSAILIGAAFLTALAALVSQPPIRSTLVPMGRLVSLGPGLLTGWLSLAAPLGINLAVQSRGLKELPAWAVLPSTLTAASIGVLAGAPEVGAVLIWAAALSEKTPLTILLGVAGLVSAIAAVVASSLSRTST